MIPVTVKCVPRTACVVVLCLFQLLEAGYLGMIPGVDRRPLEGVHSHQSSRQRTVHSIEVIDVVSACWQPTAGVWVGVEDRTTLDDGAVGLVNQTKSALSAKRRKCPQ